MISPETAPPKDDQRVDVTVTRAAVATAPVPVDGDAVPGSSADRDFAPTLVPRSPLIAPGPDDDDDAAVPTTAACSDEAIPATAPEPGSNLFVAGLAPAVDDAALEQAFSKHGRIMSAKVMLHVDTAVSRGFGFVLFPTAAEANSALQALDGTELPGHAGPLQISVSRHRGENLSIDSRVVYVRNLPLAVAGSARVAQLFASFGTVESIVPRLPSANSTKPPINVVVTFDSVAPAKACVATIHGKKPFDECTSPVLAKLEEPQSLREQRLRSRRGGAGPSNGPDASPSGEAPHPQQPEPVGGTNSSRKAPGRDAAERQPATGGGRRGKDRAHPPQPHQHHTPGHPHGVGYATPAAVAAAPYTPYQHHQPHQHQHYPHSVPPHQHNNTAGNPWGAQPVQAMPWQGAPMFVQAPGVMQAAPVHMAPPFVPLAMGPAPAAQPGGYVQTAPSQQQAAQHLHQHQHQQYQQQHQHGGTVSGPPLVYAPVYHGHQHPPGVPLQHPPYVQSAAGPPGVAFLGPHPPEPSRTPP